MNRCNKERPLFRWVKGKNCTITIYLKSFYSRKKIHPDLPQTYLELRRSAARKRQSHYHHHQPHCEETKERPLSSLWSFDILSTDQLSRRRRGWWYCRNELYWQVNNNSVIQLFLHLKARNDLRGNLPLIELYSKIDVLFMLYIIWPAYAPYSTMPKVVSHYDVFVVPMTKIVHI